MRKQRRASLHIFLHANKEEEEEEEEEEEALRYLSL